MATKRLLLYAAAVLNVATAVYHNVTQVHIAYGHDPARSMSIAWVTNESRPLTVQYYQVPKGNEARSGLISAPSTVISYTIDDNPWGYPVIWGANWDDPPTWNGTFQNYTSAFIHNTTLVGLEPGVTYLYQIKTSPHVHNFTTGLLPGTYPPDDNGGSRPYTVSIVGDIGQTQYSMRTRDHVMQDPHSQYTVIGETLVFLFVYLNLNSPSKLLLCSR